MIGAAETTDTVFQPTTFAIKTKGGGSIAPGVPSATDGSGSSAPFYKNPVTLAVAGGGLLAAIGGWMLLKGKKRRR